MLKLPDVTIWTIVWAEDRKWIVKAGQVLRYCATIIEPKEFVLFSSEKLAPRDYPWRTVTIPKLTWANYSIFVNRVVPSFICSPFFMSVHEDGFPLDVNLWDPRFLDYDYIGAPWVDGKVGNGGFNIESAKLARLKRALPVEVDEFTTPADRFICDSRRAVLESQGATFAPFEVAIRFSTEQVCNDQPSFGFHGRTASSAKYRKGWQMINGTAVRYDQGFTKVHNTVVAVPKSSKVPLPKKFPEPSVTVVYTFVVNSADYLRLAERFVKAYVACPPHFPHRTVILCNGGPPSDSARKMFGLLGDVSFFEHDNSGWDIGGYLALSKGVTTDLMFCLASSAHFRRGGWLRKIADAYTRHGPGIYGTLASYEIQPHFCTTGVAWPPHILQNYRYPVTNLQQRYDFEHGPHSTVKEALKARVPVILVTWDGEYTWQQWRRPMNVYAKGDQSNVLTYFRHSDSYDASPFQEKKRRQRIADSNPNPSFLR